MPRSMASSSSGPTRGSRLGQAIVNSPACDRMRPTDASSALFPVKDLGTVGGSLQMVRRRAHFASPGVDFLAVNAHVLGRGNSETNLVALDRYDRNADPAV